MLSTIPWLRGVHLYRSCSDAHLICFWGSDARGHCFGWSHWGWWHLQLSLRVCQHIKWWVLLFYWILTLYPRFYYNHLLNFYSAFHSQFFFKLLSLCRTTPGVLPYLPASEMPLRQAVHGLCEAWWKKGLLGKEELGRTAFLVCLEKTLILKKPVRTL